MKLRSATTWIQYALANTAIAFLIPFLALQGMPPIDWAWNWAGQRQAETAAEGEEEIAEASALPPEETPVADFLAVATAPLANLSGVATARWSMFAPEPDVTNHRLRAKLEYRDGTVFQWRSPDWPQLSCAKRFWASRELEYMDKLAYNSPPERWFAFADYLAARHRTNPAPEGAPLRVTFVREDAVILNPLVAGWRPMSQPIPRSEETVITPKRVYSLPPELVPQKPAAKSP